VIVPWPEFYRFGKIPATEVRSGRGNRPARGTWARWETWDLDVLRDTDHLLTDDPSNTAGSLLQVLCHTADLFLSGLWRLACWKGFAEAKRGEYIIFLVKNPRTPIFEGTCGGKFGLKRLDIGNSPLPAKDPAALDSCLPVSYLCGFWEGT